MLTATLERLDTPAEWFLLVRQLTLLGSDLTRLHQMQGQARHSPPTRCRPA